jgi:DNA-binding MarR family transcriptional regulator
MVEAMTTTGRTFLEDLSKYLTTLAVLLTGYAKKDAVRRVALARGRVTAGQVRAVAAAHYARSELFGMDLGNPGWNLLLELYHAFLDDGPVRLPRLARDARVSATTAARWLDAFTGAGFVRRAPDPERQGTVTFALTLSGAKAMEQFFVAIMLIRDAGDPP